MQSSKPSTQWSYSQRRRPFRRCQRSLICALRTYLSRFRKIPRLLTEHSFPCEHLSRFTSGWHRKCMTIAASRRSELIYTSRERILQTIPCSVPHSLESSQNPTSGKEWRYWFTAIHVLFLMSSITHAREVSDSKSSRLNHSQATLASKLLLSVRRWELSAKRSTILQSPSPCHSSTACASAVRPF